MPQAIQCNSLRDNALGVSGGTGGEGSVEPPEADCIPRADPFVHPGLSYKAEVAVG